MQTKDTIRTEADLIVVGTTTMTGNVTMAGTLALTGATTFTGAVTCSDTLTVDGISTLTGAQTLTGATTCSASLSVGTTSTLTGAVTCSDTLTVDLTTTLTGAVTLTGGVTGAMAATGAVSGTTGTFTGDIVATGGHIMPFVFDQADATSSQTAVALTVLGSDADLTGYPAFRAGSVVGISVTCEAARSAGTLTVDATIGGSVTGLQAVLDGSNTTTHQAAQAKDTDTFAAGALIGVKVTTDGSWAAATTPSILVVVYVEQ